MTDPKDCKHPLVERDIGNMCRCVECGTELGIGYHEWEYPPDMSQPYLGIARGRFQELD
jgi:hypothetical protein